MKQSPVKLGGGKSAAAVQVTEAVVVPIRAGDQVGAAVPVDLYLDLRIYMRNMEALLRRPRGKGARRFPCYC